MSRSKDTPHPYHGQRAALATKHQKEQILGPPLHAALGLELCVPSGLDTDVLGTFSGEIERPGTPRDVALRKARLGMEAAGLNLGIASEGSFGPHPQILLVPIDHELLAFVDDHEGIEVIEQILSTQTNYAHYAARSIDDLTDFMAQVQFPSHGLIVRPQSGLQPELLYKGVTTWDVLETAVKRCAAASENGVAHVETDMRAHLNPTRQQVLREVAVQLGRRLATRCPQCLTPGWGLVNVVRGLPCEWCGAETNLVRTEVYGCPRCDYQESLPRSDGLRVAAAGNCPWCNP